MHGQRVALNLAGVERTDVKRGHVVCDPRLDRVTDRIDAWVEIRPAAGRPVESHEVVRLYVGTAEAMGKLVLVDGRDAAAAAAVRLRTTGAARAGACPARRPLRAA